MLSSGTYKAKKLLRLSLEHEEGRIKEIQITGDFFLYPEESIEELEESLQGKRLEKSELSKTICEFLVSRKALGFDEGSLSDAILSCVKGESKEDSGGCFK